MISLLSYDDEVLLNELAALVAYAAFIYFRHSIFFMSLFLIVRLVSLNVGKFIINPNLHDVLNSDINMVIGD